FRWPHRGGGPEFSDHFLGRILMPSSSRSRFRIDVAINDLLVHSAQQPPAPPAPKGATLPEPVFPQYPELLSDPGPEAPPEKRRWRREHIMRKVRGWLI